MLFLRRGEIKGWFGDFSGGVGGGVAGLAEKANFREVDGLQGLCEVGVGKGCGKLGMGVGLMGGGELVGIVGVGVVCRSFELLSTPTCLPRHGGALGSAPLAI